MSYEGYVQILCENGHYLCRDAYEDLRAPCSCGAALVWHNDVDETNGDCNGYIEPDKFTIRTPAVIKTCECCGHETLVEDETFVIPSDEETKSWQTYYDQEADEFKPLRK